jgi:hypothetical protein
MDKQPSEQPGQNGCQQPCEQPSGRRNPAAHLAAHRWTKGRSGNPAGRRSAAGERKAPALLLAMRHVTTRPETADRTSLQREARLWLQEDRSAFLGKLADLEKAYLASLGTKEPAKPAVEAEDGKVAERPKAPPRPPLCARCARIGMATCAECLDALGPVRIRNADGTLRLVCQFCYRVGRFDPDCERCKKLEESSPSPAS